MTDKPKIKECVCNHTYQDARYGNKMRVMNPTLKEENGKQQFRCTVCGRMHDSNDSKQP